MGQSQQAKITKKSNFEKVISGRGRTLGRIALTPNTQGCFRDTITTLRDKLEKVALVGLMAISAFALESPSTAKADSLGYPWGDAAYVDTNYDWGYSTCPSSDSGCMSPFSGYRSGIRYGESDPWGYYLRNCTSYTAWKLSTFGVPSNKLRGLGNGGDWYNHAPLNERALIPKAWDAAVELGTDSNPYGHVAFVESVDSIDPNNPLNDTITVSEYNHDTQGHGDRRTGPASAMGFTEFVDFGVHPGGLNSTPPAINTHPNSDINGDGNDDLLLLTHDADGAVGANVGLSTSSGFWMKPEWWHDPYTDWDTMKPLVGDVTGDGKADLVYLVPTANGTQAWVAPSTGNGYLSPQLWWNGNGYQFSGIKAAIGDMDGNGAADLVLATHQADGGTAVSVALSTQNGFWLQPPWWTDTYTDWNNMAPLVGDVTGDGVADFTFLVPTTNGTNAWVLPSTKAGLQTPQLWWQGDGYMYDGIKMVMGDVDGNGAADLVLVTRQVDGGTAVSLALSTESGFWLQPPWWTDTYTDWSNMTPFIGDFTASTYNNHPVDDVGYIVPTAAGSKAWILHSNRSSLQAPQTWWGDGWGYAGIKVARAY